MMFLRFHYILVVMMSQVMEFRYNLDIWMREKKRPEAVRVAVFEHIPQGNLMTDQPRYIIQKNLDHYSNAVRLAANERVQLLVFPEDSLINSEAYPRKVLIEQVLEEMPDPDVAKVNLCHRDTKETTGMVLRTISCLALTYRMFIALCFGDKVPCTGGDQDCPADGHRLYNSIALFDWNGVLVAKYHKMQLYYEFHYNIPKWDDRPVRYYDSPFGRLGFIVCMDLMYQNPGIKLVKQYKIDTIIYSTYWFNYAPFVNGIQFQQAFAMVHRINFLAACVQIPSSGTVGSGIHVGDRGAVAYSNQGDGLAKLIVATIPTDPKSVIPVPADAEPVWITVFEDSRAKKPVRYLSLNVSTWTHIRTIPLELNATSIEWCGDHQIRFCCRAQYEWQPMSTTTIRNGGGYMMIAGSGISGVLGQIRYPVYQEFCGVVWCEDVHCHRYGTTVRVAGFRSITVSGRFQSPYVYPSVLENGYRLLNRPDWRFVPATQENPETRLVVPRLSKPVTAITLYGRHYELDPPYYQ